MKTHQKALIITTRPGETHNLDELNLALSRGWRVAHVSAMGGAGAGAAEDTPTLCFAALVVLERQQDAVETLEHLLEEAIEPVVEGISEGDGSDIEEDVITTEEVERLPEIQPGEKP
jgi:hypothetical protein